MSDLSTPQALALLVVASAAVDERHGVPVDVPDEQRFVWHGLLAAGFVRVHSARAAALTLGFTTDLPDLYVITDAGAAEAVRILTR